MIFNPFKFIYLAFKSLVDFIQIQYAPNNPHDAHLRDVDISDGDSLQANTIRNSVRGSSMAKVRAQGDSKSGPTLNNDLLIVNPCNEVNSPHLRDPLSALSPEVSITVVEKNTSHALNSSLDFKQEQHPERGFSINDYKSPKSFKDDAVICEANRTDQHRAFIDEFKVCDNLEASLDVLHETSSNGSLDDLPNNASEIGLNLIQLLGVACPIIIPLVFFAIAYFDIKL